MLKIVKHFEFDLTCDVINDPEVKNSFLLTNSPDIWNTVWLLWIRPVVPEIFGGGGQKIAPPRKLCYGSTPVRRGLITLLAKFALAAVIVPVSVDDKAKKWRFWFLTRPWHCISHLRKFSKFAQKVTIESCWLPSRPPRYGCQLMSYADGQNMPPLLSGKRSAKY